jgi:hypothetical protein
MATQHVTPDDDAYITNAPGNAIPEVIREEDRTEISATLQAIAGVSFAGLDAQGVK